MKALKELFAIFGMSIFTMAYDLVRSFFLKASISVVDRLRTVLFTLILSAASMLVIVSGIIFLHAAVFLSLPWEFSSKIILMAILGGLYILVPTILLSILLSRRRWVTMLLSKKVLDEMSKK